MLILLIIGLAGLGSCVLVWWALHLLGSTVIRLLLLIQGMIKFPFLTAWRNCDLTGDPTVQWIYLMSLRVDGRSYACWWYSVGRAFEVTGVVIMQMG